MYANMFAIAWYISLFCYSFSSLVLEAKQKNEIENGESYGHDWVVIYDEKRGDNVFVNLTLAQGSTRRSGSVEDVKFSLYTRKNPKTPENLDHIIRPHEGDTFKSEYFDSSLPVKIVTHGWRASMASAAVENIKNAYLRKSDANVILVDWSTIAGDIFYLFPPWNTERVGKYVALFLNSLSAMHKVPGSQIHLIGHSLGAHVMGVASRNARERVGRITGLDPARPLFEIPFLIDAARRLDKDDAGFVDVIHTCGGVLGFSNRLGHADFYPNGGTPGQPGCGVLKFILCSHSRAHEYFTDSITNASRYRAYGCKTWTDFTEQRCGKQSSPVYMGDSVERSLRRTY